MLHTGIKTKILNKNIRTMKMQTSRIIIAACAAGITLPSIAQAQNTVYPKTAKDGTVDVYFGEKVPDPYRWLENDTSKATAQWVKEQNKVTAGYISKIPFRGKLLERLTSLTDYERVQAPFKRNGKYYFFKNDGLQNQSVLYVRNSLNDTPRVFLDPNTLSKDGTVALTALSFSNNGKYVAYAISRSGSDWQEIFVLDAVTGKHLSDHIVWTKFPSISWYGDGFYYGAYETNAQGTEYSDINENQKIYYHKIGTRQAEDLLYHQDAEHPKLFLYTETNQEETHLFLYSSEGSGNTLHVKDLSKPGSQFKKMASDMNYQHSVIDVVDNMIYIYTTEGAPKGRVMSATTDKPEIKDWKTVVPEADGVLSGAKIIGGKLFLTYSKDASDHAQLYTLDGKHLHEIKLPSLGSVSFSGTKYDKECFFSFSSFTMPGTVFKYDIDSNTSTTYYEPKVNFTPGDFVTEQIFFNSKDGTRVPMFVTYKKGMRRNGQNPTLLYGYGGFNISITPAFQPYVLPFIESGGIFVSVNLRGGSEYGEEWHLAGTKMNKQNVFDDFIAAAEYMIANKYTNPSKLAIRGGSNGGLLVGACMIQRPDLYRVVSAHVGVMDMLRYHKFTIGWNWAGDYGTSEDSKEMFEYLKGYSPLHNLKPGVEYPATLIFTADHDDRVVPAHSFKFAARLQECNAGLNPTLIRIESEAGHGGGKPISKTIEENADDYSFIMYNLGMSY